MSYYTLNVVIRREMINLGYHSLEILAVNNYVLSHEPEVRRLIPLFTTTRQLCDELLKRCKEV